MDRYILTRVSSLTNVVALALLLFIVKNADATSGSVIPPTIQVIELASPWRNITGRDGAPPSGVNSVYADKGSDLFLRCTANYPIQWNIKGIIVPQDVVKFQAIKRDLKKETFQIQINIFFLEAENYTELVASAIIACEKVGNAEIKDEFGVFVKGNRGRALFIPGNTRLEDEPTLIPCFTSDPTATPKPSLYFRGSAGNAVKTNSDKLVTNVIYHPSEGFRYTESVKEKVFTGGVYTCRQGAESVVFTVVDSSSSSVPSISANDYYFAPVSDVVRKFSDESMEFTCSSKTKSVKLTFDSFPDTVVKFTSDSGTRKQAMLTRAQPNNNTQSPIVKGKVKCSVTDEGKDKIVKEWSWEFVDPPELHLDNMEGEVNCLSPLSPKIAQTVRCASGMECDFMGKTCLQDKTSCNFKRQKQFYGDMDTYCWVDSLRRGSPCASVPFSHLNGVAKCGVMDMERRWEFFISLDYIRYTRWTDAPKRELVRFEENTALGGKSKIVCSASAYLFADSLAFEIQYKNGSRSLIQEIVPVEVTPEFKTTRQIFELNVKAILDEKHISSDVDSIYCLAPFWNSTDILRSESKKY